MLMVAPACAWSQADSSLNLTPTEQTWLDQHPLIRLGVDRQYLPLEMIEDNGSYVGISADYIELISQKLGITFEIHSDPSMGYHLRQYSQPKYRHALWLEHN